MHACVRGLAGVPCVSSTYGLTIDGEWLRQRLLGLDFVERALLLPPEVRVERAGMHSLTRFEEARGLVPERPYRFHVCAVNGSGRGLWGHIRLLAPYLHVTPLRVLSGFR